MKTYEMIDTALIFRVRLLARDSWLTVTEKP